jgi:hypothetical protein
MSMISRRPYCWTSLLNCCDKILELASVYLSFDVADIWECRHNDRKFSVCRLYRHIGWLLTFEYDTYGSRSTSDFRARSVPTI